MRGRRWCTERAEQEPEPARRSRHERGHPYCTAVQRTAAYAARLSKGLVLTPANAVCSSSSRAISSAGERFVHTEEVTGSKPVSPTRT